MRLSGDTIWTIPNGLTVLRLLLVIPMILCLSRGHILPAAGLMILAVVTDLTDGLVARKLNQCSDFGRLLDPVVDKLAVVSVSLFLVLSPDFHLPLWFFVFVAVREIAVLSLSLMMVRRNSRIQESNKPGKRSAFAIGIAVLAFAVKWEPVAQVALWVAVLLTLYSTAVYFRLFLAAMRTAAPSK